MDWLLMAAPRIDICLAAKDRSAGFLSMGKSCFILNETGLRSATWAVCMSNLKGVPTELFQRAILWK
jgi:hypothetical protein